MPSSQTTTFGSVVVSAVTAAAITGTTLTLTDALSTTKVTVDVGTGSGETIIDGSLGGAVCLRDTDDAGWSVTNALNGSLATRVALSGECD